MKIDFESINQFSALQKRLAHERTDDMLTGHHVYEISFTPTTGAVRLHCQFKLFKETVDQFDKEGKAVCIDTTVLGERSANPTLHLDAAMGGGFVLTAILDRYELYQMLGTVGLGKYDVDSDDVDDLFWTWQREAKWREEVGDRG